MASPADTLAEFPWELLRGVLLTLTAMGVAFIAHKMKDVTYLKNIVVGVDGTNGLRGDVKALKQEVKVLTSRNVALDAIHEAERDMYDGPDKRRVARRIIDGVKDSLLDP